MSAGRDSNARSKMRLEQKLRAGRRRRIRAHELKQKRWAEIARKKREGRYRRVPPPVYHPAHP